MNTRRVVGIVALIAIVVVAGLLAVLNNQRSGEETETAFAPAVSTDESVPAPDAPLDAPAVVAEVAPGADGDAVAVSPQPQAPAAPQTTTLDETPAPSDAADVGETEIALIEPDDAMVETTPAVDTDGAGIAAPDVAVEADPLQIVPGQGESSQTAAMDASEPEPAVTLAPPSAGQDMAAAELPAVGQADDEETTMAAADDAAGQPSDSADSMPAPADVADAGPAASGDPDAMVADAGPAASDDPDAMVVAALPQDTATEVGPEADAVPSPAASAPDADGQPVESEIASAEAPSGQGPTEAQPVDETIAEMPEIIPSFDVVRVEPSGDVVMAGLSEPNASVEVLDGVETIATAKANDRGEWALVLDQPLSPGSHDLAIRTLSPSRTIATLSDQRVAVSVPEAGASDVLVVVNTPDAASRVLQVPAADIGEAPASKTETSVAAADTGEAASADAAPETVVAAMTPGQAGSIDAPPETTVAAVSQGEATPAAGAAETPVASVGEAAPATADTVPESDVAEATPGEGAAPTPASPEPEPEPEPVIVHAVAVTAVEADTAGTLYVAGTAETGEGVRVYVDDDFVGQARPTQGGTWLVEVQREMPAGTYQVRADQIDTGGEVLVRAQVPFQREIDVAELRPVGSTGATPGAKLSGELPALKTVIIKRGDNLWTISRKTYGRGIRYSTIYQANRDQIRNPRWIFPGQVFVLPAGNTEWSN